MLLFFNLLVNIDFLNSNLIFRLFVFYFFELVMLTLLVLWSLYFFFSSLQSTSLPA